MTNRKVPGTAAVELTETDPLKSVLCYHRINGTHIFLGGGFYPAHEIRDPFQEDFERNFGLAPGTGAQVKAAKGRTLDRAWIFDGLVWQPVAKMNQKRQNFACSLAFNEAGEVRK